ncbi:S-layer homology domain-containing protein [Paenibacillus arenilitoris]|uniref:S-layer homology domain-containing protein n=1 Tax=Paenibacillus arenilitoris TaxID=2772299 RepID=A0A927CPT8_9BACL|nr:S-layer homology domain-containing protein [Paenibacillus arenilitoris]MBD2871305.1 S-layer homology domain-containing protein [Paenibacillus arenilitoris]
MKKRIRTAVAATVVMLTASLGSQALAADAFGDIASSPNKAQIEALQEKGIVKGVSAAAFHPEDSLTAAQGISLIVRTTQISLAAISFMEAPTAEGIFLKVSNDAWYAEDFIIAHFNGLGIPADIDPQAPLTKEQFVHYLIQAVELTGEYPLVKMYVPIADEADINVDYQGTIQRALLYKIASLDEEGNFDPAHVLTRAEAAGMLYEAYEFIEAHRDNAVMEPEPEA